MSRPSPRARLATVVLALTAAGASVAGTVAGLGVPASATAARAPAPAEIGTAVSRAPDFLAPRQLPDGKRYGRWTRGPVYDGVPRHATFCLDGALPATPTRYVTFQGKDNVAAEQYVTVLATRAEAAALVTDLREQIEGCYAEWLALDIPEYQEGKREASWRRYGTSFDVEDGVTIFGVFTTPPKGFAKTTHLFAVGRDDKAAMVVHLAVIGGKAKAPVKRFERLAERALAQVF